MTSSRLPGKVLLPIGNKPVLAVMLERLNKLKDKIIIATTNDGSEKPIIDLCNALKIPFFQGDTENVLERYYLAAKQFGARNGDGIVRLTSDCPLTDVSLVAKAIDIFKKNNHDMVSLGFHTGFPIGIDACIFTFEILKKTYQAATASHDLEHVTLGMAKFNKMTTHFISALKDYSSYRLTLDEIDDYKAICEIYKKFNYKTDFSFECLMEMLKKTPAIKKINQHVIQKHV